MAFGFFTRRGSAPPQLAPLIKPLTLGEMRRGEVAPSNVGYWTEEALAALQRYLRDAFQVQEAGLPPGQFTGTPTNIQAGVPGDTGSPAVGWSTGLHQHHVLTGVASALSPTSINTEGTSNALARADHTHDMSAVLGDVMSKVSLGF